MNFLGVVTVVFTILKLVGVIDWSWFWVLSPTLIPVSIVALAVIVAVIIDE